MKNKVMKVVLPLIMSLLLTGCWDSVEIDRKAFVSAIGVDSGEEVNLKESKALVNGNKKIDDLKLVRITYSFPDIRNMDTQKGTTEKLSLTIDGYSLTDAYIKAISKTSRNLHFGHSKLLIISEEFFEHPDLVNEFMDYIERTPSINRAMAVAVSEGRAEELLALKPMMEDGIDNYIISLLGNSSTFGNFKPVSVTKYIEMIKNDGIAILPLFSKNGDNDATLKGGIIIDNFSVKEKLSIKDMDNLQILKGNIGACKKVIVKDNHPIDYYIKEVSTKLKPELINNQLYINYIVETKGDLSGYYSNGSSLNDVGIKEIEDDLNKAIGRELLDTTEYIREGMKLDILGIKENLEKYHPMLWKDIKDQWPNTFYNSKFSITVSTSIKTIGIAN